MEQNIFINSVLSNINNASIEDIKKVLELAKEAYYNTGEELISDVVYDELEKKVGLENVNYVGTKHNPSYIIKHPFTMGSLSKVQIHEKNGIVDWPKYFEEASKYYNNVPTIVTPKFDGCSWELVLDMFGDIISISSRGDGEYGKDLRKHLESKFDKKFIRSIMETTNNLHFGATQIVLRGEALVKKSVWETSFKDRFVNTRAMASGILNHDYDSKDKDFQNLLNNLDVVCYFVAVNEDGSNFGEVDWIDYVSANTRNLMPDFWIEYHQLKTIETPEEFSKVYNCFSDYRNKCEYPLDGIVVKPKQDFRTASINEHRPSDSVAIKFIPMLQETEVIGIEWSSGKTNELTPVLIYNTVDLDGKKLTRVRGNNYGWLIENKVSIGTKIIVSLAGDIIPYIYKVTDTTKFDSSNLGLPENISYIIDGVHCMLVLSEKEISEKRFYNSALTMNIPKLGPAGVNQIIEYFNTFSESETDDFFNEQPKQCPDNFLLTEVNDIIAGLGYGVVANAVAKSYKEFDQTAKLEDYIQACCFTDCGKRISEACAEYLLSGKEEFESMTRTAYEWVYNKNSDNYKYLCKILEFHGKTIEDFKQKDISNKSLSTTNKTYVILTGEPNEWRSKADFINNHPEYEVTGSWKKCQIVFTNDLASTTGKMKKAKQLGIEIRTY